jgi:hypothetical protein
MDGGGCVKLVVVGAAVVVGLPVLVGMTSTALFCRHVAGEERSERAAELSCDSEPGSPCAAAREAFEAAAAADTEALRRLLSDPAWLDRLPPAATATPAERGQFYLLMLLGERPSSIEQLRGAPLTVRAVAAKTALDGGSASVGIEVVGAESRKLVVELRRGDAGWRLVPPEAR